MAVKIEKLSNGSMIHLGIYGLHAMRLIRAGFAACGRTHWVSCDGLVLLPDNEIGFKSMYTLDQDDLDTYCRVLMNGLRDLGLRKSYALSQHGLDTFKKQRDAVDAKVDLIIKTYEVIHGKAASTEFITNLEQISLLGEYFTQKRDNAFFDKNYSKEAIEAVFGTPADPFTTSAVESVQKQIDEADRSLGNELAELADYYRMKKRECEAKYERIITDLKAQLRRLQGVEDGK